MNKFKKKSKTKGLALGIAILSSAAVVSTGFAAWVISGGDEQPISGKITADSVENNNHTLSEIEWTDKDDTIYYGKPVNYSDSGAWLTNTSDENEDLELSATFTVHNVLKTDVKATDIISSTTKFEETTVENTAKDNTYATANAAGYVGALPTVKIGTVKDSATPGVYINIDGSVSNEHDLKFTIDVVFTWGSHFDSKNPFGFYKEKEKNDTSHGASDANVSLAALNKMNASFKLTIVTE